MKSPHAIIFTALMVMFATVPFSAPAKPLKIGVVLPLTGSMSIVGEAVQRGIEVSQDRYRGIEVLFEDDQYMPRNTVLAVQRLIDTAHVDGLIVFGSGPSLSVVELAESRGVPMISIAMNDTVAEGKKNVYRIFMTSETQNRAVCDEVKRRSYKRIAVALTTSDAMIPLRDKFLKEAGDSVVIVRDALPGESDFRTIAARINETKPDAVYILLLQSQIGPFTQQLREAGYKGAFFGGVQSCSSHEIKSARGAMDGGWCVSFEDTAAGTFYSDYTKQFGEDALPESLLGYEAAHIYAEAGRAGLRNFLNPGRVIDGGILGRYTLAVSHTFEINASIRQIKGDNPVRGQ